MINWKVLVIPSAILILIGIIITYSLGWMQLPGASNSIFLWGETIPGLIILLIGVIFLILGLIIRILENR